MQKESLTSTEKKTIAVAIAVQKLGQATLDEIKVKLEQMKKKKEIDFDIKEKEIARECKKLQKKDLISTNYIVEDGRNVLAYSTSKPLFKRGIEGMQFMDIVDSDLGGDFIQQLDKKKGANKGRLPDIRDYKKYKVKWVIDDPIGVMGFIPRTKEGFLEHYRDAKDKIIFLPKHFRAYLRDNQRKISKSNLHNYIGFNYGSVNINGHKITKFDHYILDNRQGRGLGTHEVLPSGVEIETEFSVPSMGGLTKTEFKSFLDNIAQNPIKGFGGASSQGFGKLKLVDFQEVN